MKMMMMLQQHRRPIATTIKAQSMRLSTRAVDWIGAEGGSNDKVYRNWIQGQFVPSGTDTTTDIIPVKNPATNDTVATVQGSTTTEVQAAIDAASAAFPEWKQVPVQRRQRIMMEYQSLIREHTDDLAYWITLENGKTLADARGDIFRGLEVVESACNMADKLMGETLGGISTHMDCVSYRQPLGVCAGIGEYNERMIWSIPG